ncbi:MAG: hypothetical protein ISR65_12615 [Bacteriovoracaceae bacterium]|nr:hypothetical protein [Bacteriovoracaceae bacterium]
MYKLTIFVLILVLKNVQAGVPFQLLINASKTDKALQKANPLNSIIAESDELVDKVDQYKVRVANYRGMIDNGEQLHKSCKVNKVIQFATEWDREQTLRGMLVTLQYVGLNRAMQAISAYAKYFEFTPTEYNNLTTRLSENYCSQNLLISNRAEIKKALARYYQNTSVDYLPTIADNHLYSDAIKHIRPIHEVRTKEFELTIKIFRNLCSWGYNTHDLRLMVPLVRNPVIMASVIENMMGQKVKWRPSNNSLYLVDDPGAVQLVCHSYRCKQVSKEEFRRSMAKRAGTSGLKNNLIRLYCQDLKKADFVYQGQEKNIKRWIDETSLEEQYLLAAQYIALESGLPDLFIRSESFSDARDFLTSSMDSAWSNWAKAASTNKLGEIYFEEPLTIERVQRHLYFTPHYPRFKVVFDVNLGEFDRTNQIIGKLKASFTVKLPKNFLEWIRRQWRYAQGPEDKDIKRRKELISIFKEHIKNDVQGARAKLTIPPWRGDISRLIVKEVLTQLNLYEGNYFYQSGLETIKIPVELNYGLFALKHLRRRYLMNKQRAKL